MTMQRSVAVAPAPPLPRRAAWALGPAAGIFVGVVVFDGLPAAFGAVGPAALLWALGGFALIAMSGRLSHKSAPRWAAAAGAGVWLHSLLEGLAAGAGMGAGAGRAGGFLVLLGLMVHLIPESVALFAISTDAGLPPARAIGRCAVTWVVLGAGLLIARMFLGEVPARPLGAAMGLAAGTFLYLAWRLWQRRGADQGAAGAGALLGLLWVAAIHLY